GGPPSPGVTCRLVVVQPPAQLHPSTGVGQRVKRGITFCSTIGFPLALSSCIGPDRHGPMPSHCTTHPIRMRSISGRLSLSDSVATVTHAVVRNTVSCQWGSPELVDRYTMSLRWEVMLLLPSDQSSSPTRP